MTKKTADLLGFSSLLLSAVSVIYMLALEKSNWLVSAFLVLGVGMGLVVLLTMVPRKSHLAFLQICAEKPTMLYLRLILSILFFICGWYIIGAMEQVYGLENPGVASNGNLMLCPLFSMFGHVILAGCVKKAKILENSEPISPNLGKLHKK